MYEYVKDGYNQFLVWNSNISLFEKVSDIWVRFDRINLFIKKDGIVYQDTIQYWESLDKRYVEKLCADILESKRYNLKIFLTYLLNNKIITSNAQASEILEKCRNDLSNLEERLAFYTDAFDLFIDIETTMKKVQ